jgi:hypothetical protein
MMTGDPGHAHDRDLFPLWPAGRHVPFSYDNSAIKAAAEQIMILEPAPSQPSTKDNIFMRMAFAIALGALVVATPAMAQTDNQALEQALSTCLVKKSTGADREAFVRWILGSLASSSLAQGMVTVDPAAKDSADRAVAATYARLMTVDCLNEILALKKAGDEGGVQKGFSALGAIAMQDAMTDPSVGAAMGGFVKFMPVEAMKRLTP